MNSLSQDNSNELPGKNADHHENARRAYGLGRPILVTREGVGVKHDAGVVARHGATAIYRF